MDKPVYHVVVQGIHRAEAFASDTNKEMYWERVVRFKKELGIPLYAFVIFDNHAHFLFRGTEKEVSGLMRRVAVSYSHWYRRYYNHEGTVFRGRPAMEMLSGDGEILKAARFIHQEPVRKGIVDTMDAYPWSSYWMYESNEGVIDKDEITERLRFWGSFQDYMTIREPACYLEEKAAYFGYPDEEVEKILNRRMFGLPVRTLEAMPVPMRNYMLAVFRFTDRISILQLARVSGIGRGIIQRITRQDLQLSLFYGEQVYECNEEGLPRDILSNYGLWNILRGGPQVFDSCDMEISGPNGRRSLSSAMVYVERTFPDGNIRRGMIGRMDLEYFSRAPESREAIRLVNEADLNQAMLLLKERQEQQVEKPGILMFVVDPGDRLIGPFAGCREEMEKVYDLTLPEGGQVRGFAIPLAKQEHVRREMNVLADPGYFSLRLHTNQAPFILLTGAGENELAAAAMYYEQLKVQLGPEAAKQHPARFVLVEIANLEAPENRICTMYPVIRHADCGLMQSMLEDVYPEVFKAGKKKAAAVLTAEDTEIPIGIPVYSRGRSRKRYPLAWLLPIISEYRLRYGGELFFVDSEEEARALGAEAGNLAFIWESVTKEQLLEQVLGNHQYPRGALQFGSGAKPRIPLEERRIR